VTCAHAFITGIVALVILGVIRDAISTFRHNRRAK